MIRLEGVQFPEEIERAFAELGISVGDISSYYDESGPSLRLREFKAEVVKPAWRRAAHKHHPDKPGGNRDKFERALAAYDRIMGMKENKFHIYAGSGITINLKSSGGGRFVFDFSDLDVSHYMDPSSYNESNQREHDYKKRV